MCVICKSKKAEWAAIRKGIPVAPNPNLMHQHWKRVFCLDCARLIWEQVPLFSCLIEQHRDSYRYSIHYKSYY